MQYDKPNILVHYRKNNEITLEEAVITNLDLPTRFENKIARKYDFIANELSLLYECKVNINIITWNKFAAKYSNKEV